MTTHYGISRVTRQALAVGGVIENGAQGVVATHSRTRIDALLVNTGSRPGTV